MKIPLILGFLLVPLCLPAADVVIYGGTSGGITAAIQTARMGKTAILIEPTKFLGGLTTGRARRHGYWQQKGDRRDLPGVLCERLSLLCRSGKMDSATP